MRMMDLERENFHLKRLVADLPFEKQMPSCLVGRP
jgi:hypothetical protein